MGFSVDQCLEMLQAEPVKLLPLPYLLELCARAKELMVGESNVRRVSAPVTVVGDVHGQLYGECGRFGRVAGRGANKPERRESARGRGGTASRAARVACLIRATSAQPADGC